MSSYYYPKKFIFNDEQIFLKNKMPNNKRIYFSASSTVEASIVIPLFIYAVMTVIYLIQIIGLQVKVQQALYNESRKMAKYIYVYDLAKGNNAREKTKEELVKAANDNDKEGEYQPILENGIGIGVAETLFLSELGTAYIENAHVVGGAAGFNMLGSKIMSGNNQIQIVVSYSVKNPYDVFGLGIITFTQCATTNAWLGDTDNTAESEITDNDETIVYITPNGSVYHTNKNCPYLVLSIHKISTSQLEQKRNESGGKYYACEKCGSKKTEGSYYITDYGDRYHTTRNCSSLLRNIMAVKLSTVSNRQQCNKCKGK